MGSSSVEESSLNATDEGKPSPKSLTAAGRNNEWIRSARDVLVIAGERPMVELFSGLALDKGIPIREYDYLDTQLSSIRDIRLLQLLPGKFEDDLSCNIFTFNLDDPERWPYEAVSYMWKDEHEHIDQPEGVALRSDTIFCQNGSHIKISKNLNNLLRRLRDEDKGRALWVDQICINQEDKNEQLSQIPLMQHIYEKATQVLFWIGEEDEHTDTAFKLADKIWKAAFGKQLGKSAHPRALLSHEFTHQHSLPPFPGPEWESLSILFQRQVYRRAWIIQELTLNKLTQVICGSRSFSFISLAYAARFLVDNSWASLLVTQYGSEVRPIFLAILFNIWLRIHATNEEQALTLLVASTRRFSSTFPEDKVYALIGLAKRGEKGLAETNELPAALMPQKGKLAWEIFQDVTLHLIKSDNSLHILSTKQDPSLTKTSNLPSWVPDYTVWPEVTILGMPVGIPYSASGTSKVDASITATNKLRIKASRIDKIISLGNQWQVGTYWVDQFKEWFNFLDTTSFVTPHPSNHENLWRTLIGNYARSTNQYPAPKEFAIHYDKLVASCFRFMTTEGKEIVIGQDYEDAFHARGADIDLYADSFQFISYLRRIFVSEEGRIGLAPRSAAVGDELVVMAGGRVPFVLRKREGREEYEMIAECYLHGIMNGEEVEAEGFSWNYIDIV